VYYAREISRVAPMEVSSVHDAGKLLKQNEASVTYKSVAIYTFLLLRGFRTAINIIENTNFI